MTRNDGELRMEEVHGLYSSWCKLFSNEFSASWGWEMVLYCQGEYLVGRGRHPQGNSVNVREDMRMQESYIILSWSFCKGEFGVCKTWATRVKFFSRCNFLVQIPHRISLSRTSVNHEIICQKFCHIPVTENNLKPITNCSQENLSLAAISLYLSTISKYKSVNRYGFVASHTDRAE